MAEYEYHEDEVYVVQVLSSEIWVSYPDWCARNELAKKEKFRDGYGFSIAYPFCEGSLNSAVRCILSYRTKFSQYHHRIIDRRTSTVVWEDGAFTTETWETVVSVTLTPQEEQMSDVDQALLIPRTTLIETLNARLAEEQAKREEADASAAARRQHVLDAVAKLSTDQVTNLLSSFVNCDADALVKFVEGVIEEKKYISKSLEVTRTEDSISKYVRVLELATNENIEVTPRDPVYPLL